MEQRGVCFLQYGASDFPVLTSLIRLSSRYESVEAVHNRLWV